MEIYLLKSAACLAICYVFYKLFLEKTSLHTGKRIYLLGSILVSFIIPFLTFTTYVEVPQMAAQVVEYNPVFVENTTPTSLEKTNYLAYILWSVYGLGVIFFGINFGKNLFNIIEKIRKNPSKKNRSFYHVLIKDPVAPHTFFNYLFFNKKSYDAKEFPKEVFWHEEAHAIQKHSADLVCIELIQVLFWFNPLFYFIKSAIKLNHEFLADREVLRKTEDTVQYQKILLSFSTPNNHQEQGLISFANSINYSSIKKRFTVMKTQTSKTSSRVKGVLIIPLLCLLIYGFSTTQNVEKVVSNTSSKSLQAQDDYEIYTNQQEPLTARSISIHILNENVMEVEGIKTPKKELYATLGSLHTDITKKQRDRIINIHVSAADSIAYSDLLFIQKVATTYGYHRIVTPKEEIIRSKGNVPMAPETEIIPHKDYANEFITGAAKNNIKTFVLQIELSAIKLNGTPVKLKHLAESLNAYTKDWEETDYTDAIPSVLIASTPKGFLDKVDVEFKKTHFSKANGGMPIIPPPPPSPIVTKGEISNIPPPPPPGKSVGTFKKSIKIYINKTAIYVNGTKTTVNSFAKTLDNETKNWTPEEYKLYGLSIQLDGVTQDFADRINEAYKKSKLAKMSSSSNPYIIGPYDVDSNTPTSRKTLKGEISIIPPPPPPPSKAPKVVKGEVSNIPPPPPPPPTLEPIDHVIDMAKKGARFYYDEKEISSDRAIQLLKNTKNLNIQTTEKDGNNPKVKISTKPFNK